MISHTATAYVGRTKLNKIFLTGYINAEEQWYLAFEFNNYRHKKGKNQKENLTIKQLTTIMYEYNFSNYGKTLEYGQNN